MKQKKYSKNDFTTSGQKRISIVPKLSRTYCWRTVEASSQVLPGLPILTEGIVVQSLLTVTNTYIQCCTQ